MEVKTYNLQNSEGKHIRKATKVILDDGKVIAFTEKLSKKKAIAQIVYQKARQENGYSSCL
ncbi:hypothetical protein LCGC14_2934870 [marine sediment metagenome]|uniref:Uncharacterized protein n=1 Tax=marine sediment metagenome TaxID=412755 RepID=A0A0F8ZSI6_9ZZZZ